MGTWPHDMYRPLALNTGVQFRKREMGRVESDTFLDIYYEPAITLSTVYLFSFNPQNNT